MIWQAMRIRAAWSIKIVIYRTPKHPSSHCGALGRVLATPPSAFAQFWESFRHIKGSNVKFLKNWHSREIYFSLSVMSFLQPWYVAGFKESCDPISGSGITHQNLSFNISHDCIRKNKLVFPNYLLISCL